MEMCLCCGVNTCLLLITHLSGWIKGSGSRSRICFFSLSCLLFQGFNADQTGMTWRVGALFLKNTLLNHLAPLFFTRQYAQPLLLNILCESHRERSVFNYLRAVVSIQVESSALEEVKMTAASSEITAFQ